MTGAGAGDWRRRVTWGKAGALASGILLALAFPPFEDWQTAWGALVPLLLVLFRSADMGQDAGLSHLLRRAFRAGYLAGAVFWLVALFWMLTLLKTSPAPAFLILAGYLALAAYCALFVGGFAMTVTWCAARLGMDKAWKTLVLTPATAVIWVAFEYGRGVLLGGFPWNALGISQFRNVGIIQCAEWAGVAGVSALIVLVNAGVSLTVVRYLPGRAVRAYRPHIELFLGLASAALVFRAGLVMIRANTPPCGTLVVAAVQPGIPQAIKWSQQLADEHHATLRQLTEEAFAAEPTPDLVIWPETATPYPVNIEGESQDLVGDLTRHRVPMLVGTMVVTGEGPAMTCYNSSLYYDGQGRPAGRYDKQHLVPFGETIPFSGVFPLLARLAPMGWNCSAGSESTIFHAGDPAIPFSTLICFEDIMSGLARKAVCAGARLLINQTNDAWFDGSAGPVQHLSHCVFRAIENRVPVIRVANTGITCLIQPNGRIEGATVNSRREPPRATVCQWLVHAPPAEGRVTRYRRLGDWGFAIPCTAAGGACFILAFMAARRKMSAPIDRGEQET